MVELTEISTILVPLGSRIVNPVCRVLDGSRMLLGMIPLHPVSCSSVAVASMSVPKASPVAPPQVALRLRPNSRAVRWVPIRTGVPHSTCNPALPLEG